uniref:tRNA-2-methylthio-N(6)-dimethylallyladenosine synthase n=1 Tax=Candidatus Methanophagaceae archaeon ANME-1 ERB6 TaxID=2759912 RepID=A0A7G9YTA3_9EURY|nr:tRNA-2-methylthio-N(6)-dimethylallyladenosine synthase [Methanosarcinales archaeon ANME-1 ERB6]
MYKYIHIRLKNKMPENGGVPIVLTASTIEMSDFNLNPFIAFSGGFPKFLVRKKLYPPVPFNADGTAKFAPYGLRKVESLLIEEFGEENVVTVYPTNLHRFIGPKTKIVGISTMDPLGIGFVSRTYTSIFGINGKPATLVEFENLLSNLALRKSRAKIIVGGSGTWQISSAGMQDKLGIDTILIGQAEHSLIQIFRKALNGEKLDRLITMQIPEGEEIPVIKKPSIYGTVEITRGCGRGCAFCSPTLRQRYSLPLKHILKEVELNAKSGTRAILLQTDDVFLYKSKPNFIPSREAIVKLIQDIDRIEGVDYIQIAHSSLAPVVYDRKIVEEIAPILVKKSLWRRNGKRCASIEVGIETGSVRLMEKYMKGKMLPYKPEQWHDIVVQSVGILNDNNIYPLATLILGLPGEQEEDILATLNLLDRLKGAKILYVPLLFTSEEECILKKQKHKDLKNLDELHWDILARCGRYDINTWKPEINKIVMLGSLLSYPYYRWRHGKKIFKVIMKFTGLEEIFLNKKLECQPKYCTHLKNHKLQASNSK